MTRFNSTDVTRLLERPMANRATAEVPEGFFEDIEKRILDATVDAKEPLPEEPKKPIISMPSMPKVHMPSMPKVSVPSMPKVSMPTMPGISAKAARSLKIAAAAVALIVVCGLAIKFMPHTMQAPAFEGGTTDIFAVSDNATEGEINDLEEIYEADIFLEDM